MNATAQELILANQVTTIVPDTKSLVKISEIQKAIKRLKDEFTQVPRVSTLEGEHIAGERDNTLQAMKFTVARMGSTNSQEA